ncbi:MAG: DUF3098 domain-containing protein [Cytophagaceae bacterium]|jgi:hypothetical protein|nr:DUF3098 domain-containing protein [Cytophagaceae bacterium]
MSKKEEQKKFGLALDKENYLLLIIAVVIVIIGFLLMTGGSSDDPLIFNEDTLYGFRRIRLAPMVVLAGFAFGVYAIMKKPKSDQNNIEKEQE